ncbi:gliding motility-associated C-terminal domain-containing protein [Flavobacterium luteum]|uniref:Gliding motility-associated C-terminal domain-containing protein n=1 Tax=Flavobacterium luteum TaxID=2026654 RepID=A0A7J5A8X6_9FLAO|nr:gliding motility-associated C-terminal domain-containing protein [Flavobacterium luteum]KAB1153589.1 gliding motility-associated C-terminal domain-containing protein [Flavobacterium luteum]
MKNKLLLFLLLHLILGINLAAKNYDVIDNIPFKISSVNKNSLILEPIKKKSPSKSKKNLAVLSPPSVVAGSSCGPGIVALSATGASGETIEWYTSQTAAVPIFIGNNYNPNLLITTTFYVQSKLGADTSIRVPVVGSVYSAPPPVTLTAAPANNLVSPLCLGTSVTFTATGGADLFEFSVNGVVTQTMSSVRTYTTNSLTNGQTVSVRSRYAVNLDGSITETAWGTGALEDNILSAALSGNATTGYINSLKISPAEDKIVIGMSGKVLNFRRIMVFLDTKPGGYNISNYGDENGSLPPVRAFNFFNNNPSTFDSYFAADYCVAIATDAGETNYYADVIELRNPNSLKTYLGTAATGVPTSVMGINKNNTGTSDYNLGFEVEVSKALIGYTTGDVKFFALTMQDNDVSNYNVTNSFLSPERTSTSDYGNGAINYNLRDPNPVVVAEAAFTPCYSEDSLVMNFVANPTVATVGANQTRCLLTSNPLGGNTPTVGTGLWTLKSGPGTVSFADNTIGNTTATVSVKGTYIFTWTITSGQCSQSFADISIVFNITNPPTGSANQSFCEINNRRVSDLVAIGNNVEWFLNPIGGSALPINTNLVTGNYYAEQTDAITSCKSINRLEVAVVIDKPAAPSGSGTQTVCNSGTIANLTATGTNIKWYVNATGGTALASSVVLISGTTYYASQTIGSCESATRYPLAVTIINPQNPISGGNQSVCSTSPLQTLTANATVTSGTIVWYDAITSGSLVASPTLNTVGTRIYYAQNTIGVCNSINRTAVSLEIKDSPFLSVTTKSCSLDLLIYSVDFTVASGSTITRSPLVGSIVGNSIIGIPAGIAIDITADKGNGCVEVVNVVAPNCSCSPVNNPVSGGDKSVCQGQSNPALTATVTVGETIDWYSASSSGSTLVTNNASFTPLNTIPGVYTYYAQARKIVDGCLSSGRTAVSLTITAQVAPTGALTQTFCESQNATVADLVATGTSIKWYPTISSSTVLLSSASLVDGEDYFASQTAASGFLCESVNRLRVTVNIIKPLSPTGSSIQSFCESENATIADLLATGTSIKWYSTLTSTIALSSSALLVDGEDYFATQTTTSGLLCESVNRLKVTVSISKPAAPIGSSTQSFCESQNAIIASLLATGTNIKWYSSAISTTALISTLALADGDYFATQTTATGLSCESVNRFKVTVTINKPAAPSGLGTQIVCNSGTIANLNATGTNIKWYANPTGGTALTSSIVLISGTTYYATQTVGSCESVTRYPLVVTIVNPQIPTSGGNQSVCATSPLQTLTATATVVSGTIDWFDALTNGNLVASPVLNTVGSVQYYAQNKIGSCFSTSRTAVTLEIKDSPFLNITNKSCSLDLLTYTVNFNVATGSTITRSPEVGSIVGNSITGIPAGTAIDISANKGNGCVEVINVVAPNCSCSPVNNPISGGPKSVCEGQANPSLSAAVNTGEVVNWYSAISGGSPLVSNSLTYTPLNTIPGVYTYFAEARKTVDGCISSGRTPVSLTIVSQAAPTGSVTQTFCESENATVANLVATGTTIKWYETFNSTTALSPTLALIDGEDYYATQSATSGLFCESTNRFKVTVIIDKPLPPVVVSVIQPTCAVNTGSILFSSLPNNGSWILTPSVGIPVSGSGVNYEIINLSASTNYTFKVTNGNGCTSVLSTPSRINAIPASPVVPTAVSVVQPTCALQSGTITFATQNDVEYSIDGINYKSTPQFSGLAPKSYTLYVRNTIDKTCVTSSANAITINSIPNVPIEPSATSVVQPTCAIQSGSITIATQSGVEYSINGTSFQSNPIFSGLAPNTYTLYVRNFGDTTCISSSVTDSTINALPTAPAIPTITSVIQPTCSIPTGTIVVASQNGLEYSIGNGFQNNPEFENLVPGKYAISVRFINNTSCIASGADQVTINSIPESIQFAITGDCENKKYELTANPINNTNFPNDVFFEWKDSNSSPIGSDSNVLNVSDILASTLEKEDFPLEYNLTISSSSTGCETTNKITVTSVFCDIQKGISPDGNGSNDNFDLSFRKVKKLEIFNRYGLKLYSKMNYTNQWEGQTDNGDILPSATYYYVIEFNTGEEPITGWIYLIRDNDK